MAEYQLADYVMFLLQSEQLETLDAPRSSSAARRRLPSTRRAPSSRRDRWREAGWCSCAGWRCAKDLLLRDKAGLIAMVLAPALLNLLFALIFYQAATSRGPITR